MTGQTYSEFAEPAREHIPAISRMHIEQLEKSNDDAVWQLVGMHHLVLHTVGRKSGNVHKVALPYWVDPEGRRIVVASFSGAEKHPAWYLNLSDSAANPDVFVHHQEGTYRSVPEVLEGEEYDRIWALLVADRPNYADYQTRTERRIPLVRLA